MTFADSVSLNGRHVSLVPLSHSHHDSLVDAVKDGEFEHLNCIAVEFRTHFFNMQSRAAIERLGAKLDGVLRQHQIASNGTLRDTCVYSILDREWPTVKAHLTHRLNPA